MAKVKRSEVATYMDITPGTEDYELIGVGVVAGEIAYNPNVVTETYIHQDSANMEVEGYAPSMPVECTAVVGDNVFDFVDALRISRAILGDAETSIVNVWLYKTPTLDAYPAEQQPVSISIDSFGGDGGAATKINYTINYRGDPVEGMFDVVLGTFTPNP